VIKQQDNFGAVYKNYFCINFDDGSKGKFFSSVLIPNGESRLARTLIEKKRIS